MINRLALYLSMAVSLQGAITFDEWVDLGLCRGAAVRGRALRNIWACLFVPLVVAVMDEFLQQFAGHTSFVSGVVIAGWVVRLRGEKAPRFYHRAQLEAGLSCARWENRGSKVRTKGKLWHPPAHEGKNVAFFRLGRTRLNPSGESLRGFKA